MAIREDKTDLHVSLWTDLFNFIDGIARRRRVSSSLVFNEIVQRYKDEFLEMPMVTKTKQ